jgi:hypothetical protein
VLSTPSIIDGISPAEERLRRAKGINFIYQAGVMLDLPQITLWVAGVFFHRFYMRCSMVQDKGGIHHYVRALVCDSIPFHSTSLPPFHLLLPRLATLGCLSQGLRPAAMTDTVRTEHCRNLPISGQQDRRELPKDQGDHYRCCSSRSEKHKVDYR